MFYAWLSGRSSHCVPSNLGLVRGELDQGLLLTAGAEDMLRAQPGESLPPLAPKTPSGPWGLHAMLFLTAGRGCWGFSSSGPLSVTVEPAQVPSCIQHCSLRLALARPQERRQGHRARKAKLALGLLAGCLRHTQDNRESVQVHFQEPLRRPRFQRDPRQPQPPGHSTHLLPHPETGGSVAWGTSFGLNPCLFAV